MKETLQQLRRRYAALLEPIYGRREAFNVIDLLLEMRYGYDRLWLLMNPDATLDEQRCCELDADVGKMVDFYPVQYLIGSVVFHDCLIKVCPDVLIPRPETSQLIDIILSQWSERKPESIIDVCCGSGCIAISLAKSFPLSKVKGMDLSERAVEVARCNADLNGVKVCFSVIDVLKESSQLSSSPVDLIVSNPPYVCESEKVAMSHNVVGYEPDMALFVSDDDPLVFYRSILNKSLSCLSDRGEVWFEINESKKTEMSELCESLGYVSSFFHDVNGKPRFCKAKKSVGKS